jgi:hypothetical protein
MRCPFCGHLTLKKEQDSTYLFKPPPNIPGGTIEIPHSSWRTCLNCEEDILSHELSTAIDREAYRRL